MEESTEMLLTARLFTVMRHRLTDDAGCTVVRESVQHPGAVVILPVLDGDRVCLIRNRRFAVDQTLIELPAGTLEPGEPPEAAARRELTEETGLIAGSIDPLHEFYMSPGILNERMHLFLATDLAEGQMSLDPGEKIERFIVPWFEAMAMTRDGQIQDAKTLVGLLLYDRLRANT